MAVPTRTAAHRRWDALVRTAFSDPAAPQYHAVQRVVISMIFLSVATIVLETVHPLHEHWQTLFDVLEWVFLVVFGLEYVANVYVAPDRRAYILSFWGVIDLLAILPSFAALVHVTGLQELRTLRVLRVLRTLKLIKLAAVRAQEAGIEAEQRRSTLWLDVQIYLIALFTVMIISATLVYHAESGVPDTPFTSIPEALWWAIGMVATHGSPYTTKTLAGRSVAGASMLAGVALFGILTNVIGRALLTSLFGADPADEAESQKRAERRRQLRTGAQRTSGTVAQRIEQVIESAGPLPALRTATGAFTAQANHHSHGRPLSTSDAAYLLRSQVATEGIARNDGWPMRVARAAFVEHTSRLYRIASMVIIGAIFLSVAAITLESVDWIAQQYALYLRLLEGAIVAVFTIEYAAQVYVAENRRQYVFSFWGIVDLLSILPTYIGLLNVTGLRILRTLRVLRVLRILKLSKSAAVRVQQTMHQQRNTFWLDMQIYFIALFTAMILSATMMWYAEKDASSGFTSIPEGLWFSIITLTTTGSGTPVPVTFFGRVAACLTAIAGIALFGVLTSVIGRTMLASLFGSTGDDADGEDEDDLDIAALDGMLDKNQEAALASANGAARLQVVGVVEAGAPPRVP